MNRVKIVSMLFVLAFFSLPGLLSFGIRYLPANDQAPLGATESIYSDKLITGNLLSSNNNLNGVGLSFRNPNLQNKEEIILRLTNENGELLRTSQLSGRTVPDGGFVRFMFEPVAESKGVKYSFTLTSPSSSKEDALSLFLSRDSASPASVVYYKPVSRMALLRDIYTLWIGRFWQDRAFGLFYLGTILLGFGYLAFGKDNTI